MNRFDPAEIVSAFFKEWDTDRDRFFAAFRTYLSDDVIWDNVGLARTQGVDQAIALMETFEQNFKMATMKVDLLAIAVVNNKVLTERIDRVFDVNRHEVIAIPLMGILEVNDHGLISRWSDYFDSAPFKV